VGSFIIFEYKRLSDKLNSVKKMKIALTSKGPTLDDEVEGNFGRSNYFLIVDPDKMKVEAIRNPYLALSDDIGRKSAQLIATKDVPVVLTGNCGPNAIQIFDRAGITVLTGIIGKVRHVVKRFKKGTLSYTTGASVQNHFGVGKGIKPDRGKRRV
jgi:predicted Fe-Mo cluster-binding NifX family protein